MSKSASNIIKLLAFTLMISVQLFPQGKKYEGPDDPSGDKNARKEGWMSGNRIYLYFQNNTELAYCCGTRYSKWPNNDQGLPYTDGVALLIGARVFMEKDTVPVTDINQIRTRKDLDTLYYLQTSYREGMHSNPMGTIVWGLEPVPGYSSVTDDHVAMSNIPASWPKDGWPAPNHQTIWPGEWNGRFGRGVMYAQQETFFVANDAQDQKYLQPDLRVRYSPRPGIKIGDINPLYPATQKGMPWGGLGIRIQQRGYQWSNPQAQDAIFWEYDIANTSDYDLNEVAFGYWLDNGIGGNTPYDDIASFNQELNLCYSWDFDGIGEGGLKSGVLGFAFLESPGLGYDGIDNDNDGIIDEKRDNLAARIVGPTDGIADMDKFLKHYNTKIENLKSHWDADEDQDWMDGIDANGNGKYDSDEFAGDDIGLDGVGPLDINYKGPDADGTECNHKPDYKEGFGCEPNFAATDIDESDMVGLKSFELFPVPSQSSAKGWFKDDPGMWAKMSKGELQPYSGSLTNLVEFFSSGIFPLFKGRTERISMAMINSYDGLEGLNSSAHSAPVMFRNKEVVQAIYEHDYRFAQPPILPTLSATAGDGKVVLTWDDVSDTRTHEPLDKNKNDFEGYKLFRATDKYFRDAEVITDGQGTPTYKKPIFQCDVRDGKSGYASYGTINGSGYYLGNETGVTHYFIDNTVQNGRTYYYALVAYDYGLPDVGGGISPSENPIILDLDEYENIRDKGRNVKIVVPGKPALGYVAPYIKMDDESQKEIRGSKISLSVTAFDKIKPNHKYKIKFNSSKIQDYSDNADYQSQYDKLMGFDGFKIYDITAKDTLIYYESPEKYTGGNLQNLRTGLWRASHYVVPANTDIYSDVVDGVQLSVKSPRLDSELDIEHTGWLKGKAPIEFVPTPAGSKYFPWDYEIVFTQDTSYRTQLSKVRRVNDTKDYEVSSLRLILDKAFKFYIVNKSLKDSLGQPVKLDMVIYDQDKDLAYKPDVDWILAGHIKTGTDGVIKWTGTVFGFRFPKGANLDSLPKPNDVYQVKFLRPLNEMDSLSFTVMPPKQVVEDDIKKGMDQIKVVPNPYVATNSMEPEFSNHSLNQRRQLMFTHIPAQCNIKIFTVSGVLVDEINVNNAPEDGKVHWNMLTKEGLEIAAGVYVFYVKSNVTGTEKIGKFAVIK